MATVTYIKETRQHISAMRAVMRYCQREEKTTDPKTGIRYVTGLNCNGANSFTEFLATKTTYNKLDGINFSSMCSPFHQRRISPMSRLTKSAWNSQPRHGRGMRYRLQPTVMLSISIPIS